MADPLTTDEAISIVEQAVRDDMGDASFKYDDLLHTLLMGLRLLKFSLRARREVSASDQLPSPGRARHCALIATRYAKLLTEKLQEPRYRNDCEHCKYRGQIDKYDIYFCKVNNNTPTQIIGLDTDEAYDAPWVISELYGEN